MNSLNNRFWNWYDDMKDPYRFIFMITILASPIHIYALTGKSIVALLFVPILTSRILHKIKNESNE